MCYNQIKFISTNIYNLINLNTLYIYNNQIKSLPTEINKYLIKFNNLA
jgi:Leucine-rich repeat (LRR) protein